MRTRNTLLGGLLALLTACGGGADPAQLTQAGRTNLGSGNYEDAAADFQAALDAIGGDMTDKTWFNASMGLVEAKAYTDPAAARADFLMLAEKTDKVTAKHFSQIGGVLGSTDLNEAVALLTEGKQLFPGAPDIDSLLQTLGDRAAQEADPEALEALKGLGYVGD